MARLNVKDTTLPTFFFHVETVNDSHGKGSLHVLKMPRGWPCLVSPPEFYSLSHQIFRHIHEVLNID